MNKLTPPERLIVAADFKPTHFAGARNEFRDNVLKLADNLAGTGVIIKLNSIVRACGYDLFREIHDRGLLSFGDLKLIDISETLSCDGMLLREAGPSFVTVMCAAGISGMKALKAELPDTEVLGVTVLTTFTDDDTRAMFVCTTEEGVSRMAGFGKEAKIDGLISSPAEAIVLRSEFGMLFSLNTPGVRFEDVEVKGDDQNKARVMTPRRAIESGVTRIVMGRPITQSKDPRGATQRAIDEIASASNQ